MCFCCQAYRYIKKVLFADLAKIFAFDLCFAVSVPLVASCLVHVESGCGPQSFGSSEFVVHAW